jgi:DNA-binding SARP family transcriptional activator
MEMEWHRQADHEARLRLSELNLQLDTLLSSIIEYDPQTESQCPAVSVSLTLLEDQVKQEVSEHPTLWQRIRNLFNFITRFPDSSQLMAKVVVNAQFPSTGEKGKGVINVDNIDEASACLHNQRTGIAKNAIKEQKSIDKDIAPGVAFADLNRDDTSTTFSEKTAQNQDTPPSLMVYSLGTFRVYQNDQLVKEWPSSKGKSIFKYLVAQRNQPVPKEVLMELFWPGAHPDAARNNLNVSIYGLRQALRSINPDYSHILFQEESYLLNPVMELWVDFEEFTKRIQIGRQKEISGDLPSAVQEYQAAEALYQGEFLAEDRYEDWLIPQRLNLQAEYLKLLDGLSQNYIEQKDFAACLAVCTKMLAVDSCREEAHRRLMRCYSCQGQPYLALRQYHMCEEALREELDLSPSEKTEILYNQIRTGGII